jgi:hypothetical protein
MKTSNWEVIVGNIGTVYAGTNRAMALEKFATYVESSQLKFGRASGEDVTLFQDNNIVKEFEGTISRLNSEAL